MEIIRLTDTFYQHLYHGNNHKFNRELYLISGVPADFVKLERDHSCCDMDYNYISKGENILTKINIYENWLHNIWGAPLLFTTMKNQWISNTNLTGWINPRTGKIGGFAVGSAGIDINLIKHDISVVSKKWPYLKFIATCYGEKTGFIYKRWKVENGDIIEIDHPKLLDITPSECISSEEINRRYQINPDYLENWWTIDELKILWFKDKFCDPQSYYIKKDGRFTCIFIPTGEISNLNDYKGNIYNLRRKYSYKKIRLTWENIMKYKVNENTYTEMKPDKENFEGPYKINWK